MKCQKQANKHTCDKKKKVREGGNSIFITKFRVALNFSSRMVKMMQLRRGIQKLLKYNQYLVFK